MGALLFSGSSRIQTLDLHTIFLPIILKLLKSFNIYEDPSSSYSEGASATPISKPFVVCGWKPETVSTKFDQSKNKTLTRDSFA